MTEFKVSVRNRFPKGSNIELKVVQTNGETYHIQPQDKLGFFVTQGHSITVSIADQSIAINNCNIKLPDVADFNIVSDLNTDFYRKELSTHIGFPGETKPNWDLNISAPKAFFEYNEEFVPYNSDDDDDVTVGEDDGNSKP